MKAEDLLLSLGEVSPDFLEESEDISPGKKKSVFLIPLIAIFLCTLFVAVVAAVGERHIFGIEVKQVFHSFISSEGSAPASADIYLNVKMVKSPPSFLEEHYLPVLPTEKWEITRCGANRFSCTLTCKKGENYFIYQQLAEPNYNGEYTIDTVNLGYDEQYETTESSIGGVDVFTVTVAPSQSYPDPGRQKHYWSDGRYLFILEVNYSLPPSLLEEIFGSIVAVDIESYLREPENTVTEPIIRQEIETPMYPTSLPRDWGKETGGLQPDGSYTYLWHPLWEAQTMTVLEFNQTTDASYFKQTQLDWAQQMDAFNFCEQDGFLVYSDQNQIQLLWQKEGYFFSLDCAGENLLSVQELLSIAKSVQ